MCEQCEKLKAQVVELQATIRFLRQQIIDLSGGKVSMKENPYEDEAPLVVWEEKYDE